MASGIPKDEIERNHMKPTTILLVSLALFMVSCNSKTVGSPDEDTIGYVATDNVDSIFTTPWMEAYFDYLKTDSLPCDLVSYRRWGLAYVDDDEVPEMVFMGNCEACGKVMLTQYNGRVGQWNSWRNGVDFAPRRGLIRNNDGSMGHYYDRYIRLERGAFVEYLTHEEYAEGNPRSFTIFNNDTVGAEVAVQEERSFESLPHLDIDSIPSFPIDILLMYLKK